MPDENLRIAQDLGVVSPESHRSRQLTAALVEESDLVLALDRSHRAQLAELVPQAIRRTFTLREFARLADIVAPIGITHPTSLPIADHFRAAVETVAQRRGTLPPPESAGHDDVLDPYRRSAATYRTSANQQVPAITKITSFLRRAASEIDG